VSAIQEQMPSSTGALVGWLGVVTGISAASTVIDNDCFFSTHDSR